MIASDGLHPPSDCQASSARHRSGERFEHHRLASNALAQNTRATPNSVMLGTMSTTVGRRARRPGRGYPSSSLAAVAQLAVGIGSAGRGERVGRIGSRASPGLDAHLRVNARARRLTTVTPATDLCFRRSVCYRPRACFPQPARVRSFRGSLLESPRTRSASDAAGAAACRTKQPSCRLLQRSGSRLVPDQIRSRRAPPTGPRESRQSPNSGAHENACGKGALLCSSAGRHGAGADARIGRSDRAAGLALTIQIVAKRSSGVGVGGPLLRRRHGNRPAGAAQL